jgi:hypothetical protein
MDCVFSKSQAAVAKNVKKELKKLPLNMQSI